MATPANPTPAGFRRHAARLGLLLPLLASAGCAAGGGGGSGPASSEGIWERLNQPRPEPLAGAVRIGVGEIVVPAGAWASDAPIPAGLGFQELLSAGLLRRQDVHFVERRRFAEAAERERRGLPRPPGAPPVGVSPGAELFLQGTFVEAGPVGGLLEMRLVDAESGDVVESFRVTAPRGADPTSLARAAVGGLLATLEGMGRLPAWQDPDPGAAPASHRPSGVPAQAVAGFFRGVAAEDRYDWEGARRAYQAGLEAGGQEFFEARVALARIARLRAGGSLGAGDRP